jgi:hypothetical protein
MNHSLSLITAAALGFIAAVNSDHTAAADRRELAKQSEKPLFLVDQFKVIIKGMHGEPILPTDEDFAGVEEP